MLNALHRGAGNNKFTCTSDTGSGYLAIVSPLLMPSRQSLISALTLSLFDKNAKTVTAEATFSRELTNSDVKNLDLIDGQTIYAIATFGNVFTNSPTSTGTTTGLIE